MDNHYDHLSRRCPRLGSPITFAYCKTCEKEGSPCFKIFDCWWETFDVVTYFKDRLEPEVFEKLFDSKPKPKLTSILELIEQAKSSTT